MCGGLVWVFLMCCVDIELGWWLEKFECYFELFGGVVEVINDKLSECYFIEIIFGLLMDYSMVISYDLGNKVVEELK